MGGDGEGGEVYLKQAGVSVASDEAAPVGDVELQAVVVVAAREGMTPNDIASCWVDDGKVVATNPKGEGETLAIDAKHRWIDRVALGPDAIAWSAGKQAYVRTGKGEVKSLDLPSSAT